MNRFRHIDEVSIYLLDRNIKNTMITHLMFSYLQVMFTNRLNCYGTIEHLLVFPWDQRGLLLLGVPNLLVGSVYHVKNEGCLL